MKVAVIGSRTFNNYKLLVATLDDYGEDITHILSGGAKGADSLAERYAREYQIPITIFYAQWDKYGKSAGFKRNKDIIKSCDLVIAFWDGESKGTENSLTLAREQDKRVEVIRYDRPNTI